MKKNGFWAVKSISQKDRHTFSILWNDNETRDYRLSDLQKMCPCAGCVDEATGNRLVKGEAIDENVEAKKVVSVGRYALRIEFTKGCSLGIYSFAMLREMMP